MGITEKLFSVDVLHDGQEILIERTPKKEIESCPPFCIQAMTIKNVVTVAEVETLEFIKNLKEKKARLLIDVRANGEYKKYTIPGSINLPSSMLEDRSPYQEEVLKLLGAKKINNKKSNTKWYFKNTQLLLIFGASATTQEAATVVKKLLELGYPSSKILYYRGGIASWEALGLTLL
jgi:rhodanese-related sulfurtransferase